METLNDSIKRKFQEKFGQSVEEAGYVMHRLDGYGCIAILGPEEAVNAWEKAQDLYAKRVNILTLFWSVFGLSFIVGLFYELYNFHQIVAVHALCYSIVWILLSLIVLPIYNRYHSKAAPFENLYKGKILFYDGRTFIKYEASATE